MAKAAVPFADTCIAAGLPPNFIDRLNAASGALLLVHVLDAFVQTALSPMRRTCQLEPGEARAANRIAAEGST